MATPRGLTFVGQSFFDDDRLRFGPVLVNGKIDIGIDVTGGGELPPFAFELESSAVASASMGTGTFGPTTDDGTPIRPVDAHLHLAGRAAGRTYLRIVDPVTRELFDRLEISVLEPDRLTVLVVGDATREVLRRGHSELIGVRLLARNSEGATAELRAVDQDLSLTATTPIQPENMYWDCFSYEPPPGYDTVTFTAQSAGRTISRTFRIED